MILKMKKAFVALLLFEAAGAVCFSQSDVSQLVFPKRIFVGDTAELRYTFRSPIDFFSGTEAADELPISLAAFPFQIDSREFSVENAVLLHSGDFYIVVITFVPWMTGTIDFPPFDLLSVLYGEKASGVPLVINPQPFEVSSVLPDGEDTQLRASVPPLLIPGTSYIVYAILLFAVMLLVIAVKAAVSYPAIAAGVRNYLTVRKYEKSARYAFRCLRRLEKRSGDFSDDEFCVLFKSILRRYLSVRFGCPFETVVSSHVCAVLENASGGFLEGIALEQAEVVERLFRRADYVRFARGSADSRRRPAEEFSAALQSGERADFIDKARSVIRVFEQRGKSDGSEVS